MRETIGPLLVVSQHLCEADRTLRLDKGAKRIMDSFEQSSQNLKAYVRRPAHCKGPRLLRRGMALPGYPLMLFEAIGPPLRRDHGTWVRPRRRDKSTLTLVWQILLR